MADPPLVVVSNRGPLSFTPGPDGRLQARRGAGGLVSGLAPLVVGTDTTWIAAALSPRRPRGGGRRRDRGRGLPRPHARPRSRGPAPGLRRGVQRHPLVRAPRALRARPRAVVRPRLVGRLERLRAGERGLRTGGDGGRTGRGHRRSCRTTTSRWSARTSAPSAPTCGRSTSATRPSPSPTGCTSLPPEPRRELLEGMAAHRACGFHTRRWAAAFEASCDDAGVTRPATFVSPLAPDPDDIAATAGSKPCLEAAGLARRRARRPAAGHEGRPHRALEEPPARLPRLRPPARAPPRAPGAGGVRCVRLPVARGRAGLRRVPHRGRRRGGPGSTSGGARTPGSRSSTTTRTTTRGRWPACGGPTCCS